MVAPQSISGDNAARHYPGRRPPNRDPDITCGHCGKKGHELADCVHPGEDGYIHGCPFCNILTHDNGATWCPKFRDPIKADLLYWAIERRANRPPLAHFSTWASDWRQWANATKDFRQHSPQQFPWRPQFSEILVKEQGKAPWRDFDYTARNANNLLADPATRNLQAVLANYKTLRYPYRPDPAKATPRVDTDLQ